MCMRVCALGIRCFFRGGFAIESKLLQKLEVSTTLYLFQAGFSLGSPDKNWHTYNSHNMVFLHVAVILVWRVVILFLQFSNS